MVHVNEIFIEEFYLITEKNKRKDNKNYKIKKYNF
jgi:hypothetical protein